MFLAGVRKSLTVSGGDGGSESRSGWSSVLGVSARAMSTTGKSRNGDRSIISQSDTATYHKPSCMWKDLHLDILEEFAGASNLVREQIEAHNFRMTEWQRQKRNAYNQKSYHKHAEKRRAYLRRWREKNPSLVKAQRRRELKRRREIRREEKLSRRRRKSKCPPNHSSQS